jgi:hypothetical protein
MSNSPQPPPMQCSQAQAAILALLDDECSPAQQAALAQHLPVCAPCQAYQESMRHLTLSLRKLDPVSVPAGLEDRILARLATAAAEADSPIAPVANAPSRRGAWFKAAPMAAAALVFALALPWMAQTLHFTGKNQPNATDLMRSVAQYQTGSPRQQIPNAMPTVTLPASVAAHSPAGQPELLASQSNHSAVVAGLPDHSEVASAMPSSVNLDSTYASSDESDVYYDPVSNLVQF